MSERGSALVLAIFVLAILAGMGLTLVLITDQETTMSVADARSKNVYFLAESAIEAGRQALFNTNGDGPFDDDLATAAGADATIDFDPDTVVPVRAADGTVTGFTGFNDDVPLIATTATGDGWYAVFLTNDDGNAGGWTATSDDNDRAMLTGVGADRTGAVEIVQAIVEPAVPFPSDPPAAITIFGPSPVFTDVNNSSKVFSGDDCGGAGIPGFAVPVAGLIGTPAETVVEGSLNPNTVYTSGGSTGHTTIVDLTDPTDPGIIASSLGTIDADWTSCGSLRALVEEISFVADVICLQGVPCVLPPSAPDRVVYAKGDYTVAVDGAGLLLVTGELTMSGARNWQGIILVIGEGQFIRSGGGGGVVSGTTIVADIAGPDNVYGTSDDCTGGTGGFASATFGEAAGGTGLTTYCYADVLAATPTTRYRVAGFRQR